MQTPLMILGTGTPPAPLEKQVLGPKEEGEVRTELLGTMSSGLSIDQSRATYTKTLACGALQYEVQGSSLVEVRHRGVQNAVSSLGNGSVVS